MNSKTKLKLITPPYLKKGDQVVLLAPAGFLEDEKPVIIAEHLLEAWGLVPMRGNFVLEKNGYFAGTDSQRLQDLQNALDNPNIKAIWAIRGGYGIMRILPKVDYANFIKNPKWIIGFSDVTAFHNVIHNLGFKSIHGIMPVQLTKGTKETEKAVVSLHDVLSGKDFEYTFSASPYNKVGSAKGILVGRNLSLLQSLLGSANQIKTRGKILFIEEVGEPLYKIDRLLISLKSAGFFKNIKGLVVGAFSEIENDKIAYNKTYQELILEMFAKYSFPILFDVPAGHISDNRSLIFGEETEINVGEFISCIRSWNHNLKPTNCV